MMEWCAPIGNLIEGHVLDCDKASLERALKFHDRQLYLKWNPRKNGGYGCWEIRRKPEANTPVYKGDINGQPLYVMESVELDLVHHVLDLPFLTHRAIERIKKMDAWGDKYWVNNFEYQEGRAADEANRKAKEDMRYNIKQHKKQWRDLMELVSQGHNPGRLLKGSWF